MCEALDGHEGSVSIGGRLITNFRFADDIVVNAEEEEKAGILVDRLDRTTIRYKMEIGPDKTKWLGSFSLFLLSRSSPQRHTKDLLGLESTTVRCEVLTTTH